MWVLFPGLSFEHVLFLPWSCYLALGLLAWERQARCSCVAMVAIL